LGDKLPIDRIQLDRRKLLPIDHISLLALAMLPITLMIVQTPAEFGRAIGERRRQLGITQEELAGVVGVNRRVVGEFEAGKVTVRLGIAMELARSLGLDIELCPRGR
jgi:HTH-type transcriptional regulator/antitoxin HipB